MNVTADEVRYVGNWTATEFSDAMLTSAAYILAGDGWLNQILADNSYTLTTLTTASANKGALAKAAECFYVAHLVASIPSKEDFQAGPVKSTDVKAGDRALIAKHLLDRAREMLDRAGLKYQNWAFTCAGGDDYHPDDDDDTQIDFGVVGPDDPFFLIGGDGS